MKVFKAILLLTMYVICQSHVTAQIFSEKEEAKEWTAINQSIPLDNYKGFPFKLSGYSKVKETSAVSWAGLWARVDLEIEGDGFFENMQGNPISGTEWKRYEISGEIDDNGAYLYFGAVVVGSGTFLFDDIKLEILVDEKWTQIPLKNADFNTKASNNVVPNWFEGISFLKVWRASNYKISSSSDTRDGKGFSLSIVE